MSSVYVSMAKEDIEQPQPGVPTQARVIWGEVFAESEMDFGFVIVQTFIFCSKTNASSNSKYMYNYFMYIVSQSVVTYPTSLRVPSL